MTADPITSGVLLIGIHGKAGVGKDTASDFICDNFKNHYYESFAAPLKAAASEAFGIPLDWFNSPDLKEQEHPNWGVSPRKIAQFLGTEMFRDTIPKLIPSAGTEFWIKRLALRLNNLYIPEGVGEYEEGDTVVITDVRFQNEYDWIIENGGSIIHLTRPAITGTVGILNHPSEQTILLHKPERTYPCENNGTLQDLHRKIANIIVSLKY